MGLSQTIIPKQPEVKNERGFQETESLPSGFSQMEILKGEGEVHGETGRKLTLQVTIESYPDPIVCQATLQEIYSDPAYSNLTWQDEYCQQQYRLVRIAQRTITGMVGPLASQADANNVAQLLRSWIEQDRITLADIQQLEMRQRVSKLLESNK